MSTLSAKLAQAECLAGGLVFSVPKGGWRICSKGPKLEQLTISFIDHRKTFEQHRALMVKHEKLRAQKRGRGGNRKEKDYTQKDKTATNK